LLAEIMQEFIHVLPMKRNVASFAGSIDALALGGSEQRGNGFGVSMSGHVGFLGSTW
jgi:hypothetical protein